MGSKKSKETAKNARREVMITQHELIHKLWEKNSPLTLDQVAMVINTFGELIEEQAVKVMESDFPRSRKIVFIGLGRIKIAAAKPRDGMNPRTGEPVKIPKQVRVSIQLKKDVKNRIYNSLQ